MLTKTIILQYLSENRSFFLEHFGINKIAIFGSFARNEQKETSDIDILITMDPETKNIFEKRLAFRDLLSEKFSRNVDVCHEQAIKPVFRNLIFKDVIYA